jgi:hypothetical protein
LVGLSKNIGALVVAEGIETEEEALISLELGADLLQGYYFSRPVDASGAHLLQLEDKMNSIAAHFKGYMNKKNKRERYKLEKCDFIIQDFCQELSKVSIFEFGQKLQTIIDSNDFVECIYLLEKSGIQISETICRPNLKSHRSSIFQPAQKGENHSLKNYYYTLVNGGLARYVTRPYISMATGKLCVTISAIFKDCNNQEFIVCIDFAPDSLDIFD